MSRRFELLRGSTVLGVVTLDSAASDFPWFVGQLEAAPAYATVKPMFDEMDQLLDAQGFAEASDELHGRILEPGVQMRSLDDGEVVEVAGINIAGTRVSWRE